MVSKELNLPEPRYPVLEIGISQHKSDLELLLDQYNVPFKDFLIRCTAIKESS